ETLTKYPEAVAEFFEFLVRYRGRVVPPHEVTRRDAFDYAEWLLHRGEGRWDFTLEAEKLKDGDRDEDLAVYEAVKQSGPADIRAIARELSYEIRRAHPAGTRPTVTQLVDETWLESVLVKLVRDDVITRSPTLAEVRREQPRAGFDEPVDPLIFTYSVVPARPVSRATCAQRLGALSAFWSVMQKGENADPAARALLDYNVFEDALVAVSKGLAHEKRQSALSKRPDAELVGRVIAVADGPRLVQKRNVALLWFLLLTGTRITETLRLRRGVPRTEAERLRYPGWLDRTTEPVTVVLRRKGGKTTTLALPSYVLAALGVFWEHMASLVPDDVAPDDKAYRYKLLLTEPDAPLFPPVGLWGANMVKEDSDHGLWGYKKSLGRQAVQMMLCRLSNRAGLTEAERRRIHPHGFRHLSAEAMVAEGVELRTAQEILGHSSVQTTEGYLPPEFDVVRQSAQNEILDYLAKHGFWAERRPGAQTALAVAPEVVQTYGREVEAEGPPKPPKPERAPEGRAARPQPRELPAGPAPPPRPLALPDKPAKEQLVGFGQTVSNPSPTLPYEQLAEGNKPADLVWSGVPQAKWIRDHYAELPAGYGIGRESLLVWWSKDAPLPWPVLSPGQAYPEIRPEAGLLERLERLYDEWAETQPSATLALAQWLYFLGMLTVALENKIGAAYSWVSYNAVASVGDDLRAHDDGWLYRWFRDNAHTFTAAQRRFAGAPKPAGGETAEEFWERVRTDIGVAGFVPSVPQVPSWYFEPDPVRAIYERSPGEWRAFERWIARLTGSQQSEIRTENREEQMEIFEKQETTEEEAARRFIREFYELVDEIKAPARARSKDEQRQLEAQRDALASHIKKTYGIKLPTKVEDTSKREQRIAKLLREAFPDRDPEPVKNVLGDARMFSPEAFRIDPTRHTIVHTERFKEQFRQEHLGRDSECVMRRIARSLWEKVRAWEYAEAQRPEQRRLTEAEKKHKLFITMLAQLAYVVPCPEDVERAMVESKSRYTRPGDVADYINQRIAAMARGAEPEDPVDELAADIAATYYEQTAPPEGGGVYRPNSSQLRRNAERAGPHPLRLVAASFWPV
ncbi:MAG: tyrosine-type recombinase/integrase, partial [Gammaproteobacteria bacterium]|nr:tyrosine-type recombinase/integrase [Gammaproteobacteria bacterium]NIR82898.1 tyrosine-type recombinase/integrase [Gammaproteobacteria bacterium]NIR90166.1 tyrosine-type recombinase/integrase [Gammaproteobacteria bacterium]NIU03725.1 tyrosine-type recombinase/integrase [Gammaproteobacteria bacterium]NIV51368.1 tyrosine-type recombinase/integrase [Gammaproteobacteria bacterium]